MEDPEDYDPEVDGDQVVDVDPLEDDDERWSEEESSDEFLK